MELGKPEMPSNIISSMVPEIVMTDYSIAYRLTK